ncbi:hypothetical protein G4B88_011713 [Cannabis sativa]|uniref:Uncharacterized protein n=1 Tax=Cannabis sativa TaxID=3483 RepID=A0A7J6EYA9_CANSA|nr:hypothetical protein G4B88_011713 [Cannabis sativa]
MEMDLSCDVSGKKNGNKIRREIKELGFEREEGQIKDNGSSRWIESTPYLSSNGYDWTIKQNHDHHQTQVPQCSVLHAALTRTQCHRFFHCGRCENRSQRVGSRRPGQAMGKTHCRWEK